MTRAKSIRGKNGRAPRAVYRQIGIWKRGDESISVTCMNPVTRAKEFHTTVNNKRGSIRRHSNLYKWLRGVLQAEGRW